VLGRGYSRCRYSSPREHVATMSEAKPASTRSNRSSSSKTTDAAPSGIAPVVEPREAADWQRRVVDRSLHKATQRSIDRGASLIRAAETLFARSNGDGFTVQEVADEAGQSLRTLYQYFESKDDLLLAVFEEAIKGYTRAIRAAIADLDDPLERVAGALLAAALLPEHGQAGVDRGLARLRINLGEAEPDMVARSQAPVIGLLVELVQGAIAAGQLPGNDSAHSVYMIAALNTAFINTRTLGNDYGLDPPDPLEVAQFCLQGLGVQPADDWYAGVGARLKIPTAPGSTQARAKKR